ncbi:2-phospho-L-lactate guanylyltransferase [Minwuia thermotolerans]|uniref:3-phospho-D-glycerate guanylyltransferase n=1 Tax=Minwuia thermotolerans TaxID=2056226 RepID=A0A2M9FZZ2_9PROT|nr:2-phospho-L-lactate guanylyltransferase [Minwuia thermotolerans]PJK29038.1 2-phospho-L-lactate guanylyltransferase [Minwuia thermotolerans]
MWIILPIKNLDQAKQRLSGALTPAERRRLFETMLEDVLSEARKVAAADGVLIVSREPKARELADRHGAELLVEPQNEGQSTAVQRGVLWAMARESRGVITLPGDAPGLRAGEIDELVLLNGHDARSVTLSPSHDRRGTNCIVATPPDIIPFHFGHDSFKPHCEEAEKAGVTAKIRPLPGIGLDIDTPEDVLKFLEMAPQTRTLHFLQESGIAERLRADRDKDQTA